MDRKRLTKEIRSITFDLKKLLTEVDYDAWAYGEGASSGANRYKLIDKFARADYKYTLYRNRITQLLAEMDR